MAKLKDSGRNGTTEQHTDAFWTYRAAQAANKQKLDIVFNKPGNIKPTAQYIIICYDKRSKVVEKSPEIKHFHTDPKEECLSCKANC